MESSTETKSSSTLDFIMDMDYESGYDVIFDELVEGFQALINSDLVWSLQGHYGRLAAELIKYGHCVDTHNKLGLKENKDVC
jgi:hypothetical protein